ncbi:PaaI family thioesterase [Bacillus ectoiniformans]|uniref:PaaI family thioesterase n=1 Tax=Bacillus ectoiniformans TaxID=1494429 RepID=UPI00195ADCC7|nr:PaaI family thioesterase [Bacillus ectoiniformans]
MKELNTLFEKAVSAANEKELEILSQLLTGFTEKIEGNGSYIGRLLHMNRQITEDECIITIPITDLLSNSLGIIHGGITATVLDSAMGNLANLKAPAGYGAVTTNLNIHYLSPGKGTELITKAKVIRKGSKTMVIEGECFGDNGQKIAHATGSFFIVKQPTGD